MKIYSLKSKFTAFVLTVTMGASLAVPTVAFADDGELPFDEKPGFRVENVAANKGIAASQGWLTDISDNLNDGITAYEYINQSSVKNDSADLLADGDMETYAQFDALRDLQITHDFSGTIEGIEIFYAPKSDSIGKTLKITGSKLTQTLSTFTVQGEEGKLTSAFVPLNYETNGDKLRIYSGGLYGYAMDIYEIRLYSSSGGSLQFDKITDGYTDVQNSFHSLKADGKAIIDLGEEYELAGIRLLAAKNMKVYLCSEYPDGALSDGDLVYSAGDSVSEAETVNCSRSARYLCLASAAVSANCAEIEVYAYLPDGGEISPADLVNLDLSYPSADGFEGVTNTDGHNEIAIKFTEPVMTSTLNADSIVLLDNNGMSIPYFGLAVSENEVSVPIINLESNSAYSLCIKKGIFTKAGKIMSDDFQISFKTGTLKESSRLSEIIKSVTPSDGATGVTNLNEYGFVKIGFSVKMSGSSFDGGVVIKNAAGERIKNIEYTYENDEYKLDLSCFDSNTRYTLTLIADKLKSDECDIIGDDFSMTFTTGNIFPYKSVDGYRIANVSLNKTVTSNMGDKPENGDIKNINDGNYENQVILWPGGGVPGTVVIDLGNYCKVIAIEYTASKHFDYDSSTNLHYHTKDISLYSSLEYPNNSFSNATFLEKTTAHLTGERKLYKNFDSGYARYISAHSAYAISVFAELTVYAYVKEDYMPITYEVTQRECVASTSVKNYTDDDKDMYMLISAYDENDNFVGLKCKKFVAAANATTPLEARYSLAEVKDSLIFANVKKVVIQLLDGFKECKSLAAPFEITR